MKSRDFRASAIECKLDRATISQLIELAENPADRDEDEISPPPLIYSLDGLHELHSEDLWGIAPEQSGFMVVEGCPNGDPILIDSRDDMGSVWDLDHETMHGNPLRSVAVRVANNVRELVDRYGSAVGFPYDYYDAKKGRW